MSELKVYVKPIKTNMFGKMIVGQSYYLKSEADKVIAELKAQKAQAKTFLEDAASAMHETEEYARKLYKEAQHHKYKRCLAMARWCKSMMVFNSKYGTDKKWHIFKKWRDRWLSLAEEPTWAKFLQLIHKEAK